MAGLCSVVFFCPLLLGQGYDGQGYPAATSPYGLVQDSPYSPPPTAIPTAYDVQPASGYATQPPAGYTAAPAPGYPTPMPTGTVTPAMPSIRDLPAQEPARPSQYSYNEQFRAPAANRGGADSRRWFGSGFATTSKTEYVNSNYEVDLNPTGEQKSDPAAVLDVRISGNRQIEAKDIIKIIKTRRGRPYSEPDLEEDKRALLQKGWFIDVKPRVEKTPGGYIVTFNFIERPLLHYIKIVGNHAHTRKVLLEEANLQPGDALDHIAVHQAKERMEQFYRDSGYYRAHIEVVTGDQIGDRGAIFWVDEGPKQRILDVEFEGNTIASSGRLKTLIQSKPGWFFWINSEFTKKKLDEDVETLTAYYRKLGFFYAKIDRKFVETTGYTGRGQNRAWVKVKFIIDEGPRCLLRDIRFMGNEFYSETDLKSVMKIPKYKHFNQDRLEVDLSLIKEKYGDEGFVFARVEPDPRIDEEFVDLILHVKEGPQCYLRTLDIDIVGHDHSDSYTKWQTILNRTSTIRLGEKVRTSEINAGRRRLMYSQLFESNPTQGATPDFIFNMPDDMIEQIEREEAMARGGDTVRGQVVTHTTRRPVFFADNPNRDRLGMDGFFRLPCPAPVRGPNPAASPARPGLVPTPSMPATMQIPQGYFPPITSLPPSGNASGDADELYDPMARPVEPAELAWDASEPGLPAFDPAAPVYRGQSSVRFGTPAPVTAAPPVWNQNATVAGNSAQTPSTAMDEFIVPGLQRPTRSQTIQPTIASLPAQPTAQPTTLYRQTSGGFPAPAIAQPAPVTTSGVYGPTQYNPNQPNQLSQTMQPALAPAPITTAPPVSLAPEPVVLQQTSAVYRGNPYSTLGEPTAIRYDAVTGRKLYPVDGRWVVQETRTGQLMMSVAVSSDSGLMGRFVIEEQNFDILKWPQGFRLDDWKNAFRGKGQRFRIEAVPGTEVQRYSASWETPYLFDLDYSFGVNGFYYERYYDEWYEDRIGGGVSFGKLWTPDFSTRLSLGAQQVKIYRPTYPVSQDLYDVLGSHPMYTIGFDASYNTRDSEHMPTEGHMISFNVEQVLGDYQFLRGGVDFRKYFTLHERPDRSGRWVLGVRSSLNISEKNAPIYERYFGGGFTNLRGFEFRGVTPRDANGAILGGCMEFYNSAELVFPITADDMIRGSVFVDTGTVEKSITNWKSDYRVAVGFGLRLTIPMMGPAPISLDFAFPINKERGDEKQVFSFNVGLMR